MRIFLILCLAIGASSQAFSGFNIQKWKINNGVKVLFIESHDLPILDISVVFDAGSARDGKQFGLARLTNQLLSAGTKTKLESEISSALESRGAILSSQSLRDMSIVRLRTLSDQKILTPVSHIFADILLNPTFPEFIFSRTKDQILQQIKADKQSPDIIATTNFMSAIYGNHPYGHQPIGTTASVKQLTRLNLVNFYRQYFVGRNATMVIVGDTTLAQAKSLANKIIGKLPAGRRPAPIPPVKSSDSINGQKIIQFPAKQTQILIGQIGVSRTDPDYFPLYLGNHILGGSGLVSRLSNEIREKHGLAYNAYSYFLPMRSKGLFQIGTQTKKKSTEQALKIAKKTLADFIAKGPTKQELINAKLNITGGFALKIDSNKKISEYLTLIGFYDLPTDYLDTLVDKLNAISLKQIKEVWKRRIHPKKMTIIMVGDFKKNGK